MATFNPDQARLVELSGDFAERARGGASLMFKAGAAFYSIAGQVLRPNPDLLGLSVARASKALNPNWTGVHGARVGRLIEYGPDQVRSGDHGVVKETAAATNLFRNPRLEGAEPGFLDAAGLLPFTGHGSDRFSVLGATNAQVEVIGYVLRDEWVYLRLRFVGTINATVQVTAPNTTSNPAASASTQYAVGVNAVHSGGALTNVSTILSGMNFRDSGGTVTNQLLATVTPDATGRRFTSTTDAGAGSTYAQIVLLRFAAAGAVDVTFDVAAFQLQTGSTSTSPVFPPALEPGASTRAAETFTYGAIQTIRPSRETYRNADGSLSTFLNDTVAYGAAGIAVFEASTNRQPNPHFVGASGSTPPTGWVAQVSGATVTYTRTTYQGRSALRIAVSGTVTGTMRWLMQGTTTNVAANGQTWTMTMDAMLEAGALPGDFRMSIQERTDAGVAVAIADGPARALTRQMRRLEPYTKTLFGGATVARANDAIAVLADAGAVSFTLLLVGPQLEQKPASTPLILPPLNTVAVSDRAASYPRIPVSALPSLVGGVTIMGEVEVEGVSSANARQNFGAVYKDINLRHSVYLDEAGRWVLFSFDGSAIIPSNSGYTIAAGRTRHRIAVRWTEANVGWAVSDGVNTHSKLDLVPYRSLQLANITNIYPASEATNRQLNGLVTDFRVTPGGLTDAELLEWVRF